MGRRYYGEWYTDYMEVNGEDEIEFQLYPAGNGCPYWKTADDKWVSLTATGWVYNYDDSTKKVAWKIVDGKLYNLYWSKDNWKEYPLGSQKRITGPEYSPEVGSYYGHAYFVGVDLGADNVFTNCQLVPSR